MIPAPPHDLPRFLEAASAGTNEDERVGVPGFFIFIFIFSCFLTTVLEGHMGGQLDQPPLRLPFLPPPSHSGPLSGAAEEPLKALKRLVQLKEQRR